jgi:cytidine deaminase
LIVLEFFIHKLDVCIKAFIQKYSSIGAYNIGLKLHAYRGTVFSMLHLEALGFMFRLHAHAEVCLLVCVREVQGAANLTVN